MKQKKYKLVKLFFIILTIVLLKNHSFTKDRHNDLFNEAILEYKNVNYNASLEKFLTINDELLKENKISSEILYNIGNCYYRLNKLGMAKFYYELAKMYNYKDINIKYNINLINKLTNNMEPINIINTISNFFSFEVLFTLIFLTNLSFFGTLILSNYYSTSLLFWLKRLSLIIFVSLSTIGYMKYTDSKKIYAVVIENTNLYSEPTETPNSKFIQINEAKKVIVISEKENYYAVYLPLEKVQGWIAKDKIRIIKIL